jgi:hypothetical protein
MARCRCSLLHPKKNSLKQRLKGADDGFLSFVTTLLTLDPAKRCALRVVGFFSLPLSRGVRSYLSACVHCSPTAREALLHPWFQQEYSFVPYVLPQ